MAFTEFFRSGRVPEREISGKQEILALDPSQLIPILEWGFGSKDWDNRTDEYWENNWEYSDFDPKEKKEWGKETHRIYSYLKSVLCWSYNRDSKGRYHEEYDTKGHLDPLPGVLVKREEKDDFREPDWRDSKDVTKAIVELAKYYFNKGKPEKILPLFLTEENKRDLLGVMTIRWRGDEYVPKDQRIASIERVIVNPEKRDRGLGEKLVTSGIEYVFNGYEGYQGGQGAKEVRTWIMTDREAGNYGKNETFFADKLGFEEIKTIYIEGKRYPDWKAYANEKLHLKTNRNARWYRLTSEKWSQVKEKLGIEPYGII